ncbi:MAG TPA: hypothetical protein ENN43_02215 [bacterium]|nr:hypothetical protein [bacterium]
MRRFSLLFLAVLLVSVMVIPAQTAAFDDFDLPPPPGMDDDLLPPPPGDFDFGGGDGLPPPPMDDFGELPPPPMDDFGMAPPPMDDDFGLPPMDDDFAAPPPPPAYEEPVRVVVKSGDVKRYNVVRGDSLWKISGKRAIYGNSFMWPLIFKANRSIIQDPDFIYPRQNFEVRMNYTSAERADAINKAKETPPYEPRSVPRKTLPIKY